MAEECSVGRVRLATEDGILPPSYTLFSTASLPHRSHLVLHWLLLPPYHSLPGRTHPIPSNNILPRPKLASSAMLPQESSVGISQYLM